MNKVMRVIKEKKLEITSQEMEIEKFQVCQLVKSRQNTQKKCESVFDIFDLMFEIDIKII